VKPQDVPDTWETYPDLVEDRPAMILFNLGLVDAAPIAEAPVLFLVRVKMEDPGEQGVGTRAEMERFAWFEDNLAEVAKAAGLYFVGRTRGDGHWEMCFYGSADVDMGKLLGRMPRTDVDFDIALGGGEDPQWGFLLEFLAPSPERWQWILDRRVVAQLQEAGDALDVPRIVDHAARFPDQVRAEAFAAAAESAGYTVSQRGKDPKGGERPFLVEVQREDPVELGHIHDVVMDLANAAREQDGEYVGWGAPVSTG
jgi:hypothetical protein